jgi:hypothetical protein
MAQFITFRDSEEGGELQYYIASRQFPHYVGQVVDNPYYKTLLLVPIPHTTLYLAFSGTLQGRFMPLSPACEKEIPATLVNMATWYWTNRISNQTKKYKKWLLNQAQPMLS